MKNNVCICLFVLFCFVHVLIGYFYCDVRSGYTTFFGWISIFVIITKSRYIGNRVFFGSFFFLPHAIVKRTTVKRC